jgi:hypothetical protein
METETAPCSYCFKDTHQVVLHEEVQTLEDEVSHEVYRLLKCSGCRNVSMAHYSFYDSDVRKCYNKRYYPYPTKRKPPPWRSELPIGGSLLDEIYGAFAGGQYRLAVMGIRALLEQVMISKVGDHKSFEKNLAALHEQGYISPVQRKAMDRIIYAGSGTMHRGFNPSASDVNTALDTTENILSAIYVNGEAAARVADRVPPRLPRGARRPEGPQRHDVDDDCPF